MASKRMTHIDGGMSMDGTMRANDFELTQTLGGTDTTKWSTAGMPALVTGMKFFTFTNGVSTFRVPCFPTT
jgi:hypothetical protein